MAGKTPRELREQAEAQAKRPTRPGYTRTAEGEEVPAPDRDEFRANLDKVSKPECRK
jgi:hypothetical protein